MTFGFSVSTSKYTVIWRTYLSICTSNSQCVAVVVFSFLYGMQLTRLRFETPHLQVLLSAGTLLKPLLETDQCRMIDINSVQKINSQHIKTAYKFLSQEYKEWEKGFAVDYFKHVKTRGPGTLTLCFVTCQIGTI